MAVICEMDCDIMYPVNLDNHTHHSFNYDGWHLCDAL